jgi:hypothetical protein
MKRSVPWLILAALLFTASVMAAAKENAPAKYNAVEVKHLTKADSVDLSDEYMNSSYEELLKRLAGKGIFGTVVEDGGTISDADAASAVVLECKITEFHHGFASVPYVIVDVTLSSRGDRKVIRQFTNSKIPISSNFGKESDKVKARWTAFNLADEIKRNLK